MKYDEDLENYKKVTPQCTNVVYLKFHQISKIIQDNDEKLTKTIHRHYSGDVVLIDYVEILVLQQPVPVNYNFASFSKYFFNKGHHKLLVLLWKFKNG